MLFSKAKKSADGKPKGRSILATLFIPDVAGTIRPLRETTTIFVNLLASVFATQGLFPANHPALTGAPGARRLTLMTVIGTAWSNLVFERDRIPQILLFFAVVVILGFAALGAFMMLASMFVGKAHAQMFSPVSGGCSPFGPGCQDIAMNWIQYLFNGQTMYNYLSPSGQTIPQSTAIQTALYAALAFYSEAIMVVAAVVLFYHLAAMIVNTAHHGVVMGKNANQVWAPIRLVFAVGLLIPVTGGLNTGQYIVIKMAEWGSNMAGQAWNVFVMQMASAGSLGGVDAAAPYVRKVVYDTAMSQACMATYNAYINGWGGSAGGGGGGGGPSAMNTTFTAPNLPSGTTTCSPLPMNATSDGAPSPTFSPASPGVPTMSSQQVNVIGASAGGAGTPPSEYIYDLASAVKVQDIQGACGHVIFAGTSASDPNDTFQSTVQQKNVDYATQEFNGTLLSCVQKTLASSLNAFIPSCLGGNADKPVGNYVNNGDMEGCVAQYMGALQGDASGNTALLSSYMAQIAVTTATQGWVSAATWFMEIAKLQSDLMDVANLVPTTEGPVMHPLGNITFDSKVLPIMIKYKRWLDMIDPAANYSGGTASGLSPQQQQVLLAQAGENQAGGKTQQSVMDKIFNLIDQLAIKNKVWKATSDAGGFSIGVEFTGADPLAQIVAFGHSNINTATELLDVSIEQSKMGGVTQGVAQVAQADKEGEGFRKDFASILGQAQTTVGSALGSLSVLFFTSGFMLAYFLPLIPFFYFLFGVLTWLVAVFEAVVAVPLIALAHITPDGEGLSGGKATVAYYFIFNIFLRPVLMVFGLIIAYLIFFIAVTYMNMLFAQAVAASGALGSGHAALARITYNIMYVVFVNMAATNAFAIIHHIPEQALRWMGQTGQAMHKMGDPAQIQQPMTIAAQYVDSQLVSGANKAANMAGQAIGTTAGKSMQPGPMGTLSLASMKGAIDKIAPKGTDASAILGIGGGGNFLGPQSQQALDDAHKRLHDAKTPEDKALAQAALDLLQPTGGNGGNIGRAPQPPRQH